MCKYAKRCELYEIEFCDTVNEPEKEWPCSGTCGLRGQIQPTQDYINLVGKKDLATLLELLNAAVVNGSISIFDEDQGVFLEVHAVKKSENGIQVNVCDEM